jgi:hypothetical protein
MTVPDRLRWPGLAWDLVKLAVTRAGKSECGLEEVLDIYSTTPEELVGLMNDPEFRSVYDKEKAKSESLGQKAESVYRAEAMALDLMDRVYDRVRTGQVKTEEMVKALVVMARLANMEETGEKKAAQGSVTNVQINIPSLDNPKLRHLIGN